MLFTYKPEYPKNSPLNIGIVGAGEIVKFCHLPAYKMANFNVVAIFDLDIKKARELAEEFNIPYVCKSSEELISMDSVHIIDIAIPSQAMPNIVEIAAKYKKHILCQKPLGLSVKSAQHISDVVESAGIKGAVNHQMRYSPSVNCAKNLLKKEIIGELNYAAFHVNVKQPWEQWTFWHDVPFFTIYGHTIHYFDTLRYLLNKTPEFIYTQMASGMNRDGVPGKLRDYSYLDFGGDLKVQVDVNHDNKCGMDDWAAGFRLEGSRGVIEGTNGALHNYPHGKEDTIRIYSTVNETWQRPLLEGRWFPDSFMGTMGELMNSIINNTEANNSVKDGVDTIRMVMACIESVKQNRPIYLNEI